MASGSYRLSGRDMLAYGFETRESWADDRRTLERTFREQGVQSDRNDRSYGNARGYTWFMTRTESTLSTTSSITSTRSGESAVHQGNSRYESVRWNQRSHTHTRTTSDNGLLSGAIYRRGGRTRGWVERHLYSSHSDSLAGSDYDEDVSTRGWGEYNRSSWREPNDRRRNSSVVDDPRARRNEGSYCYHDQGDRDGSAGGFQNMFGHHLERWLGVSEYDDHDEYGSEYDFDPEDDYYEESGYTGPGSESEADLGSSGDEGSSDVASTDSYKTDYSDSG
ncbi:hypothetical protein E4T56_gene3946 [Termitomyces sp. T112]|nr:hypothetical protein E4T56_gene3946 [Termitomyces sp. T112]KAH0587920.1 hypothetical protein H2248_006671 [Termitomyces sp. 'cryptogamus']